jgi:hypothetical protein
MFNRIVSVASQRRSLNLGLGSLKVGPLLISQTLRAGTPTQAQPTDIMSDAAATTPPAETTAGTPMLKWKQGTKEGVCAVTNAAGLREALKAAGAIITEDLDITVKKGPFGRMKLLALLNKADSASPTAANFEPSCTIEVAVPVELSKVSPQAALQHGLVLVGPAVLSVVGK